MLTCDEGSAKDKIIAQKRGIRFVLPVPVQGPPARGLPHPLAQILHVQLVCNK
jgi:hypothetical protein